MADWKWSIAVIANAGLSFGEADGETAVAVAVRKGPVSKSEAGPLAPTRGGNTLFENLAKIVAPTTF